MLPSEKLLFSREEAAEMLSLSLSTLCVVINRGMIRVRRNGRRVMIEKREIEKFSRTDHARIWPEDGTRAASVIGRICFDCGKKEKLKTPAARFFHNIPLCQPCWEHRSARSPKRTVKSQQLAKSA
jgi:excisionase family DNA binding protein